MELISGRSPGVTLLVIFAMASSLNAQVQPAKSLENAGQKSQKFTVGLRIGPSITLGHFPKNLPDTVLKSHKNRIKPGFTAVGQLTFPMENKFICLIEGGYTRGGRIVDYNRGDSGYWQNDFKYNFLTTSLALRKSFRVQTKRGRVMNLFASIGPNVAYLFSGTGALNTYFTSRETGKSVLGRSSPFKLVFHNVEDSVWRRERSEKSEFDKYHFNHANRFFFGADIGLGGYFPITNRQNIHIEFRLTLGQTFIKKRDTKAMLGGVIGGATNNGVISPIPDMGSFSDPLTTNMKTFNVSVGYTFDFDKKAAKQGKSTIDKKRKTSKRR